MERMSKNPYQAMAPSHMDAYLREKGAEYCIVALMEELAEFEKAAAKARRKELAGEPVTERLRADLAEEGCHAFMCIHTILHHYGVMPEMVNQELRQKLSEYGKAHPDAHSQEVE